MCLKIITSGQICCKKEWQQFEKMKNWKKLVLLLNSKNVQSHLKRFSLNKLKYREDKFVPLVVLK